MKKIDTLNTVIDFNVFEEILKNIIHKKLISYWIKIENITIFKPKNHVNFFLLWIYENKKVLIKTFLFWRSLLAYEYFLRCKKTFLINVEKSLIFNENNINIEATWSDIFSKHGINTPDIYFQNGNFIVYEFLEWAIDFNEYLNHNKDFDLIWNEILKILTNIHKIPKKEFNWKRKSLDFLNSMNNDEKIFFNKFSNKIHIKNIIHWDFKSNNIMCRGNKFYIIDSNPWIWTTFFDLWKFIIRWILNWENIDFYKKILEKYNSEEKRIILFLWLMESKYLSNIKKRDNEEFVIWAEMNILRSKKSRIDEMLSSIL
jgi:hypothetical protein